MNNPRRSVEEISAELINELNDCIEWSDTGGDSGMGEQCLMGKAEELIIRQITAERAYYEGRLQEYRDQEALMMRHERRIKEFSEAIRLLKFECGSEVVSKCLAKAKKEMG